MSWKRIVIPVAMSGAVLVGAASVGTDSAAYASAPAQTVQSHLNSHSVKNWIHAHSKAIRRDVVSIGASTIGVTPQALVTELGSGKSIAQVASEHNVSATTVENALTTAADAVVAQLVTSGKLTSPQGTKIEAAIPAQVDRIVNHVF